MPTCLPQDDNSPARRARRLRRRQAKVRYNYEHIAGLGISSGVPLDHAPSWAWWKKVLTTAEQLIGNLKALSHREGTTPNPTLQSMMEITALRVEVEAEGVDDQIEHEHDPDDLLDVAPTSGAGLGEDTRQSPDDPRTPIRDKLTLRRMTRSEAGQRIATRLNTPWQKVISDLADKAAVGVISGRASSLDELRRLFISVPCPGQREGVLQDSEFVWLRLAGPNPMVIRKATALPAAFEGQGALLAKKAAQLGESVEDALRDGRLYVCDYKALEALPSGNFPVPKFMPAPIALFVVRAGNKLPRPVAIQVEQRAGAPAFGPRDGWAWNLAKLAVQVADGNLHESVAHLGDTHLVVEPFVVATERHLSPDHPIYKLLRPHFEGTIFINNSAHSALIAAGGTVDRLMSGTIEASRAAAVAAVNGTPFGERAFPVAIAKRGVNDLPEFPYRDDGMLIWEALHAWVQSYVRLYYANDAAIAEDAELLEWARELGSKFGGRVVGFGIPRVKTRGALVQSLTTLIFTASAQHAAVNFPQYAVMSEAANFPLALYAPPHTTMNAHEADFLNALPTLEQALIQLNLGFLLGNVRHTALGEYEEGWFDDPRVAPLLKTHQTKLRAAGRVIDARNRERRRKYPYLHPSLVPLSINI
ncbi:MAG: lipoxygenase [Deltaproteobacteria bacterium]|nr:lipoxygenase [Deltaproteobacteria bacterium]